MLRVGIVGTGFMGTTHAAAWTQTPASIGGFYSLEPQSAAKLVEQYGGQVYPSFIDLLRDVDVVDICSPTHLHYEMILAAAAAGKKIVCEKPLARSYARAKEAVEFCEQAGVPLLVAHVVRFFPEYARAKQLVDQGDIGKVLV
jgi:predicted dehydrogenase